MSQLTVKQQTQKVGVPGSLINQIIGNNSSEPKVGEGATVMLYTDRRCYKVESISKDGKTVVLEVMEASADKRFKNDIGHQNWVFIPTGCYSTITWRGNAWYMVGSEIVFTKEFESDMTAKGVVYIGAHLRKNSPDVFNSVYGDHCMPSNVVDGITREKKTYSKISIVFGAMDYYYDWSF